MEDKDILVMLRGEQESWKTSFRMTEHDALRIRNLSQSMRQGKRIDLPSIDGFAEIKEGNLKLTYQDGLSQDIFSAPFVYARDVIDRAIATAAEIRRSNAAWNRIWDWVNERYDGICILTLVAGEQINATFLNNESEYVAIQRSDDTVAIADVTNKDEIPPVGTMVVLTLDKDGNTIISAQ
jgi:hypothetical protein